MLSWQPPADDLSYTEPGDSQPVTSWDLLNNSKLASALNEQRGFFSNPSTRVFIAYYYLDEHADAPSYEIGENWIYFDAVEDGCSIWHSALEGSVEKNPAKLKDWTYVGAAWLGLSAAAASGLSAMYTGLTPMLVTDTARSVATEALPEALESHTVDPLMEALINNPTTQKANERATKIMGSHFENSVQVGNYFSSKEYVKNMYDFVTTTDRDGIKTYGDDVALVIPLISSRSDSMMSIAQSAVNLESGSELTFNQLEEIRGKTKTTIDTFSSLVFGDATPAGVIISSSAAEAIQSIKMKTSVAESAAAKAASDKNLDQVFEAVRPIFDTMQSVLTTAEESIQSGTELDNYEVETAVGADGGPPSIWFPEQITTYTTTISSKITSFQDAVNNNLGPTSIGAGCKLLSTLLLGKPLECSAFGDIFSAARFVDQCIDDRAIRRAYAETEQDERNANSAIQSSQALLSEIKNIALDSSTGRGNVEWLVGDTIANLAAHLDEEGSVEAVKSKAWFLELQRKLSSDGVSAVDRAGRSGNLALIWVLKNMLFPLLHPFHRNRGALRMPCNSLSTIISTFANSQQAAWDARKNELHYVMNARVHVEEHERVGLNRRVFQAMFGSGGFVATYILPYTKAAVLKWHLVEAALTVECRMRAAYHFYPYLGVRCKLNRGADNAKRFAEHKIAAAKDRANDAQRSVLRKLADMTSASKESPPDEAGFEPPTGEREPVPPPPSRYEPLERIDRAFGSDELSPPPSPPSTARPNRQRIQKSRSFDLLDSRKYEEPPAPRSLFSRIGDGWFGKPEAQDTDLDDGYAPL